MARKKCTPEENARREKIRELLQMANIGSMDDIQSLFKETIAEFMENGPDAGLCPPAPCGRYPVGLQEIHEHEALGGGSG